MATSGRLRAGRVPADGVALITGASRGIGRATAMRLAADGRPVALMARSGDALDEVAAAIGAGGGRASVVACDVTEPRQVEAALGAIRERLGPVRVLVNNAGAFLDCPIEQMTPAAWARVLAVNVTASFFLTRAVWPDMVAGGGGVIVNIASKAAVQGYAGQAAYCASKAGMLGWARVAAIEGRPHGIRVHSICPGGVDTEFIAGTALAERLAGQVMMRPEDVAEVVAFCVSRPANVDVPEIVMSRFDA
jgi:3-oxoacyl-[acyl-carrier protein] reductase